MSHKKLKEICDLIGHIPDNLTYDNWQYVKWYCEDDIKIVADVREIIFTTEFNNKMLDYLEKIGSLENKMTYALWLMNNLGNPVSYLYSLLELWTKK